MRQLEAFYNTFIPAGFFGGPKGKKKDALLMNNREFMNQFIKWFHLYETTFDWEGLPEGTDPKFFENMLTLGPACLRLDKVEGFQTLGFMAKQFNITGRPTTGGAFGYFGNFKPCTCYIDGADNTGVDTVVCFDNPTGYPGINQIEAAARRLADLKRSMDVFVNTLKQPFFIQCEETQKETIERILNKANDNEIAVLYSSALNSDSIQILQTGANPATLEAYWQHYENIEAEISKVLGITNGTNLDKKERLLVDEVNNANGQTDDNLAVRLRTREEFCEYVNKYFGLNVSVKVHNTREYENMHEEKDTEVKENE